MSKEHKNIYGDVHRKGEYIINPETRRPVKVGSRVWHKLVSKGLIAGKYLDSVELHTLRVGDDVKTLIKKFNKELPIGYQAVRGRGKYANMIVKMRKQPSTYETTKYTIRKMAKKLKDKELYDDLQDRGNFEDDLEQLIMSELAVLDIRDRKIPIPVLKRETTGLTPAIFDRVDGTSSLTTEEEETLEDKTDYESETETELETELETDMTDMTELETETDMTDMTEEETLDDMTEDSDYLNDTDSD